MSKVKILLSDYQMERRAVEEAVYKEFTELVNQGSSIVGVYQYLMKKYNIHAASTIWRMRKRAEKRFTDDKK